MAVRRFEVHDMARCAKGHFDRAPDGYGRRGNRAVGMSKVRNADRIGGNVSRAVVPGIAAWPGIATRKREWLRDCTAGGLGAHRTPPH